MALSDLELLELVERAQDERQGPIGPQGVGIRSIEQPTADAVIIALTDGRTKELRLTAGPKGDPGEAGKPGQDGKPGPAGSPGRAGAAGVGVAGAPGRDGTSIDTAIVNADGNLLLGLTDGNVLNVGRVVGPPGATGAAGPAGLPGRAGRDGKTILSGTHAPSDDEGSEGDFWIDTSSPLFDFYAKGSSGWRKLTSLRAPQTNIGGQMTPAAGGGGGSGGGGSGGGELQNTRTLPLANPSGVRKSITASLPDPGTLITQEDANKYLIRAVNHAMVTVGQLPPDFPTEGQLWWSTEDDELTLYIRVGDDWVVASPPVSLAGIESSIASIDESLMKVNANIAMNKRDIDEAILDVQEDQTRQDGGIEANARDITQLRSRIGDLEADTGGGDFLPTAGGELKGGLEINGSRDKDGKINPLLCRADGYYMSFGVNKDGEVFAGSSEGQPFMASSNWHVVTKGYLDSHVPRHFGSPYIFRKDVEPKELANGEFTYDSDWNWYAHRYDAEGDRIGVSSDHTITTDGMFKVYKYNGAINLICIMHRYESCKCGQDENDHMKWKKKASIYTHTDWLDDGKTYYLSDGFLLPQ